ncbi:hypothetical protein SAMN05216503_2080 [Polaribacter sp. KT25b]|uniref:energy transducer TonB n=1 Tax=Polaribacter sp. KT25b TaxID=1855336 RepID=UPI00087961DA|nr:hypothetical protein [Polaribacter sp. KT25b]SDS13457.1 hypothetical protein SAMN05216503_2080 [Polaribacter sp. KT25b]
MKNYLLLFSLFSFLMSFSQSNESFDYETLSDPNPKNELSLYFKKEIPRKLLRKVRYLKDKNNILLSFNINKEDKPYNIKVSSYGSVDLDNEVKKAFKKYPLEKLNIENLDRKNSYLFQIISKKGSKNIFNCSSIIIIKTPPVCKACEDLDYFEDIENCLEIEFKKHFYNTFNFSIVTENETNIFFECTLNKNGSLSLKKTKKTIKYSDEIKRTIASFPLIETPGMLNNKLSKTSYRISIPYKKGEENIYKEPNLYPDSFSKPSTDNEFSKYLVQKLPEGITEKVNLNRLNNKLNLFFELDNKDKPFNIRTSARSNYIESAIIAAFKEYPIQKLNFTDKSPINSYILQIFSFDGSQSIINTNTVINYQKIPIFPGCENSESFQAAKKCFSKGVQMHFAKKFNADLPKQLGLSKGRKRVFIAFKIDKNGDVIDIKVRAPHIKIEEEVKRVMLQMPQIKPGFQSGKAVNIKYSIPFTLIVD